MSYTSTSSHIQNKNLIYSDASASKTLATKSLQSKALGGAGGDPALAGWYEQAYAYYNAVMIGVEPQPDPAAWQEFLNQMQWVQQHPAMGGQTLDPTTDGGQPPASGTAVLPEGAEQGAMGNAVFRKGTAETTYAPSSMPIDVLSDEFTLNIDVKVNNVTVEKTQDTRLNPPTDVIKIVVHDKFATPSETVYFVQSDAKININSIGGDGVSVPTDLAEQVMVGEYSDTTTSGSGEIKGDPMKDADGKNIKDTYNYEVAAIGDVIDFNPQGGKDETHYVVGSANISVPPKGKVDVEQGSFTSPDGFTYDFKVTVTNKDGKTDTYYLQDKNEFDHNINALSENTTFGGAVANDGKVPSSFAESFTLNGGGGQGTGLNPNDTQPDETTRGNLPGEPPRLRSAGIEPTNNLAIYNKTPDVTITANTSDEIDRHKIYANNVTINVETLQDTVSVTKQDGGYLITINGQNGTEKIWVDESVQSITINSTKVDLSAVAGDEKIKTPAVASTGGASTAGANQTLLNLASLANPSDQARGMEEVLDKVAEIYPNILSNYDANDDGALSASELSQAIDEGAWPPAMPDQKLYQFFYAIDANVASKMDTYFQAHKAGNLDMKDAVVRELMDRVVQLLTSLYGDKVAHKAGRDAHNGFVEHKGQDNFVFNGVEYDILNDPADKTFSNPWELFGMIAETTNANGDT